MRSAIKTKEKLQKLIKLSDECFVLKEGTIVMYGNYAFNRQYSPFSLSITDITVVVVVICPVPILSCCVPRTI
jgi:hypothetical protein